MRKDVFQQSLEDLSPFCEACLGPRPLRRGCFIDRRVYITPIRGDDGIPLEAAAVSWRHGMDGYTFALNTVRSRRSSWRNLCIPHHVPFHAHPHRSLVLPSVVLGGQPRIEQGLLLSWCSMFAIAKELLDHSRVR